jgi:hypothetical protein
MSISGISEDGKMELQILRLITENRTNIAKKYQLMFPPAMFVKKALKFTEISGK